MKLSESGAKLPTMSLTLAATKLNTYLPLFLIVMMAITFSIANLVLTRALGPSRAGKIKGQSYESGMNPVGTARKRFNVRFYLIAMVFLVFDIEVVFLYPWATTFPNIAPFPNQEGLIWLFRIFFFLLTTVVAYVYGYRKGVFKFD
jgi:NADH-quinone oxidoreductase subunit A